MDQRLRGRETFNFLSCRTHLSGFIPALQSDTQNCTMVVVFPRCSAAGGTVRPQELVDKPLTRAKKIFHTFSCDSKTTCEKFHHIKSDDEAISTELYQEDVRDRFIEILMESGLQASQFCSIDRDEDFLKIWLPEKGPIIDFMAESLHYIMPLARSVYEMIEPHAPYPGGKPMENAEGWEVVAFAEFCIKEKKHFHEFRPVDSIRILSFWLQEWVSLDEMEAQGVISCHFNCPNKQEIDEMHTDLLAARGWLTLHPHHIASTIRHYFGEEIAFFFGFVGHLCRSFVFPGAVGALFFVVTSIVSIEGHRLDGIRTILCVPLSIWAASTVHFFERKTARVKQLWGVTERELREMPNPDWNPKRAGDTQLLGGKFVCLDLLNVLLFVSKNNSLLGNPLNLSSISTLPFLLPDFLKLVAIVNAIFPQRRG